MTLADLLLAVGSDNVGFQNLDDCAISLDWSIKRGTQITFGTDQTITPGEGTDKLGLVVWLDREQAAAAIAKATSDPSPLAAQLGATGNAQGREEPK